MLKLANWKKWFTLIELIVVITILWILAIVSVFGYNIYTADANYSNDNKLVQTLTREVAGLFVKDHVLNSWAKSFKFDSVNSEIKDIEATVTVADMKTMYLTALPSWTSINAIQFCPTAVTNANLDSTLITKTTSRYTELIVFLHDTTATACYSAIADITWKKIDWTLIRYKNNTVAWSNDYITALSTDWGTRNSSVAVNVVWENVNWIFNKVLKTADPNDYTSFY